MFKMLKKGKQKLNYYKNGFSRSAAFVLLSIISHRITRRIGIAP